MSILSKEPTGISNTARRRSTFSKRINEVFSEALTEELQQEALELIRKRRVLDFMVQPGSVSVKVHQEGLAPVRAELSFDQLSDSAWDAVFAYMAKHSYFMSMLLSSQMTEEMEEAFISNEVSLFPQSLKDLVAKTNSIKETQFTPALAALSLKFAEKIEQDPFLMFIVRGRGKEETLLELRKRRLGLKAPGESSSLIAYQEVAYEPVQPLSSSLENYWNMGPRISELSYNIRADELPASVLKWLDALPLSGVEDDFDWILETAYEKITRLAQGFGLRI